MKFEYNSAASNTITFIVSDFSSLEINRKSYIIDKSKQRSEIWKVILYGW